MTKLRLKYGSIEIDYDGPEEFLVAQLPGLLSTVASLRPASAAGAAAGTLAPGTDEDSSVSTIAQRLNVSSGPDLIMSAALSLVRRGSATFEKRALREQITQAPAFYKRTYSDNFDASVKRLVKSGRLSHTGGNSYAVPATELAKLEALVTQVGA